MTHRTLSLSSMRGITPEKLPYAPRFDLWFNAHQYLGTLPPEYRDCASPLDISRKLGVGGHMIVPDYLRPEEPDGMDDRGLGVYRLPMVPYRAEFRGVDRKVVTEDGVTRAEYRTPKGAVTVEWAFTPDMRRAGASISWVRKHAVTQEADYDAVAWLFERLEVVPAHEGLRRVMAETGEDAVVVANGSMPASPMQFIMRDLMEMNFFFMQLMDAPEKLARLAAAIGGYFERLMPCAASCPAEVVMFGANTDATITYPPFYEEHILPWVSRFAGMAHERGKLVLIHADGENKGLFDLYRQSGIDVLEAVAPAPMTKTDIREILKSSEGMTVWGGIPSVILMPDYPDAEFERFMEDTLAAVGKRPRFILGVSDTTPPDADFGRLVRIRNMLE